ncbi:hypothetical protein [Paraburkholderia sp. BCC1885]|uniref:hypothetical protein n=1 Tax=Paraburkholderia sp. BCC1885 TaxID=2562669 RepID=UPI0016431BCD|nr:hypothetical protein [Paraburkholderia sp. BCC1885]
MNLGYDDVVSICDAHGICLPVECVEMVVSIFDHAVAQQSVCDCENPEPESGAALVSNECPVHNLNPQPAPQDGADERARFEAHMSVDSGLDGVSLFRNGDGKYVQREMQAAWVGWQAALASKAAPIAAAEPNVLPQAVLDALRFYAHSHHFNIDADHQQFDTVSGEPQNWLMSEKDDDCTMIEDGSVAKAVLLGGLPGFEEPTEPIEGEAFAASPPAPVASTEEAVLVAWVRIRSDGSFEGPIMDSDSRMDGVRRTCGAWTPLYTHPETAQSREPVSNDQVAKWARRITLPLDDSECVALVQEILATQQPSPTAVVLDYERAAPSCEYFVYDQNGGHVEFYETDAQRAEGHAEGIAEYRKESISDGEWPLDVECIVSGVVTHKTVSVNDDGETCDYEARATSPQPAAQPSRAEVLETWQPIETAPKTGRTLLLGYPNVPGKWRTVRGQWMSEAYIAENWEESDDAEAGWYETSAEADDVPNCWPVTPTHWMALPIAPGEAQ